MRRMLAATVTAAAMVVSAPVAGAQEGDAPVSLVQQIITAAEESLGDESTIAVLRASDRGYDLLQIIEGVGESSLAVDGTITDEEEGTVITPTLASSGVIAENDGATAGPVGGASRAAGASSGEEVGIDLLERGIQKTSKRLDKKNDLGERAEEYDASLDVFTMLAVLVVLDAGYSIEQVILDGIMANRLDIGLDGHIAILDEKGRVLRPDGDEPSFGDDAETANTVDELIDDLADAITGEDPLAAADDSFKRQYTLTIDMKITGDGSTGTIEGKGNFGARKGGGELLSGRGTGTLNVEGACSLSDVDTTEYPYTINVPLRIGIAGIDEGGGSAKLGVGVVATSKANVTGDESAFCIEVIRDLADAYPQLIPIPDVFVRLRDGATADAEGEDAAGDFSSRIAVRVKEI